MNKIRRALVVLSISVLILLLLEAGVRVLRPGVNYQGMEQSLVRRGAFTPATYGFVPNSEGICFGMRVYIDEAGCRKLAAPEDYAATWLILGDSVAFGVGVETPETYAQLVQNEFPAVRVRNLSVPGYNLRNYRDVLNHHLSNAGPGRDRIDTVLLFYCLNDVDINAGVAPPASPGRLSDHTEDVLSFLRRNSKLYLFIKGAAADRSKSYFTYDYRLYERGPRLTEALSLFGEIIDTLRRENINLLVVLQPYEYQLRTREPGHLLPQEAVAAFLSEKGVDFIDAYEDFARDGEESAQYYLYGDHAHFSSCGHRVVFGAVMKRLGGAPRASAP